MTTILNIMGFLVLALVGLLALGLCTGKLKFPNLSIQGLANTFTDGQYDDARMSYTIESTLSVRNLLVKAGSGTDKVAICGATDMPIGTCQDEGVSGDVRWIDGLGGAAKTRLGVASAAIAAFVRISPAANGKMRTLPVAAGTYWVHGVSAKPASGDNDDFAFFPCVPYQVVVS